jgi:hypothetical protein
MINKFLLILFAIITLTQCTSKLENESFEKETYIRKVNFTGTSSVGYSLSRVINCYSENGETGFCPTYLFNGQNDSELKIEGIEILFIKGIGCPKKLTLRITFDDKSIIETNSFNEFVNCDESAKFKLTSDELAKFAVREVKSMQLVNDRNNESYTDEFSSGQKNHFKLFYGAYLNKDIRLEYL